MEILQPPKPLLDSVPDGAGVFLESGGWLLILGLGAILLLLLLALVVRKLAGGRRRTEKEVDFVENLNELPPPAIPNEPPRLFAEGVPVRLRLVVMAPAGRGQQIDPEPVPKTLNRILAGLGAIAREDEPTFRFWPAQLSDSGFTSTFHRCMKTPEEKHQPSRWILLAGRARAGERSLFVGLALQAKNPVSIGRREIRIDDWPNVLRIGESDG